MMETIQNHKREFGIGAIILAVLLIFSFYEYHEKKQAELAASQLELNGNVDLREVSLAFRNSDRITEILVDEGDTVKKGQVLAKLDTQDLNYRIDVTKSQIAAQQAVVDKMHNGTRRKTWRRRRQGQCGKGREGFPDRRLQQEDGFL